MTRIDDCLFCQRDDPQLNVVISQTRNFYARLDNFPATTGHTQIVPKRHVVSYFDLHPDEMREAHLLLQRVQRALHATDAPDGYTIGVNDGPAAGRTIDHLHIHLIPRYKGDVPDPRGGIRRIFPDCDPDAWAPSSPDTSSP